MGWLDRFANLDSASGSEVPAFFSLTPAFSPVDTRTQRNEAVSTAFAC
jgi:hypothetical protein